MWDLGFIIGKTKKKKKGTQLKLSAWEKKNRGRTGQGDVGKCLGGSSVTDIFLPGAPAFFQILILLGKSCWNTAGPVCLAWSHDSKEVQVSSLPNVLFSHLKVLGDKYLNLVFTHCRAKSSQPLCRQHRRGRWTNGKCCMNSEKRKTNLFLSHLHRLRVGRYHRYE